MRREQLGGRAVLLPERRQALPRPVVLRGARPALRRARRLRAGLRDRARSRPPRAEPARHRGARERAPAARGQPRAGQRDLGAARAAGRLLRRSVGPFRQPEAQAARARRRRGGARRGGGDRRRPAAARVERRDRARELDARILRDARAVAPSWPRERRHGQLRHLFQPGPLNETAPGSPAGRDPRRTGRPGPEPREPMPAAFDPITLGWLERRFGRPTAIQDLAWPPILAGEHVLFTAPTGSGKTLAGFLAPLDRLLTGAWPAGAPRVLYVSPLKALNADIER